MLWLNAPLFLIIRYITKIFNGALAHGSLDDKAEYEGRFTKGGCVEIRDRFLCHFLRFTCIYENLFVPLQPQFKIYSIMKKYLFIAIAALFLAACNKPIANPETPDDPITPPATAQAVYVKGFRINSIYLANMYYRMELIAHPIWGSESMLAKTDYSYLKIAKTDVPYAILLSSPVKVGDMPDPYDWYSSFQIIAYAAANTSANGAPCLDVSIPASVLADKMEHTAISPTNPTSVTILFEYK